MKGRLLAVTSFLALGFVALVFASLVRAGDDRVARGEYLVNFGGCNDCHSPKNMTPEGPQPDEKRLLSGHPSDQKLPAYTADMVAPGKWVLFSSDLTACVGPWGTSYAANLTPDKETGIGLWTDEIFVNAMRTGKHMGMGRPIKPPMPWFALAALTDDDLKSIFAYLQSLPPVNNLVPQPAPPVGTGSK